MKTRVFVCPVCHGMGILDVLVECDHDTRPRHSLVCACMGLGFVSKKNKCYTCDGKGYRDWVDDIRRPLSGSIYKDATYENL